MKRLYINPVTRTIAPKYRTQKAVYIAKNDHNSVLLLFEIPKIVDGHDITVDGNIIHIHFANMDSTDATNVSKGMSEAVNVTVDDEEGIVTFCWRIPNTATRYAGVVSIGVTIERYEDVDGTPQEVYSWSTAPYGNTIVQDSMDNSDEVCEEDFDYLAKTCNAIVELALADKIAYVEEEIDKKLSEAETEITTMLTDAKSDIDAKVKEAENYRDTVKLKVAEAELHATQTQGDAKAVATAKDEITTMHSDVSEWATNAKADADRADGYADEVYGYVYGDGDSFERNNAKYYFEQTKKYAQVNALVGEATGDGAVRIDDYAILDGAEPKITVNFINQKEFFSSDGAYTIAGDIGKTYKLSAVIKDGVELNGKYSYISDSSSDGSRSVFILTSTGELYVQGITIEEGHTYEWHISGGNASDIFESVSMTSDDISGVTFKSYGKNLFDLTNASWYKAGSIASAVDLFIPSDCVVSIETEGVCNATDYQRVYVVQETTVDDDDWNNKSNISTLVSYAQSHKPVVITKKKGYKYRIYTNDASRADHIKSVQVEIGLTETVHEAYKEPVNGILLSSPTTTLVADTEGVKLTVEYKRDINKVIAKLEQAIVNS